ncbi:cilia- and flagella-associated protein 418-like [Haliotis cracherodii]|uniref:cilia- and flagella-associated protein 418-like n=1 Tax=Haliotis cracherodii TaxID=6455 RepID=UPI0039EA6AA3
MADDIDDLLDEVETKYCTHGKSTTGSHKRITTNKPRNRAKLDDDIDDILKDDDDIPQLKHLDIGSKTSADGQANQRSQSSRKCFPVYLGGSSCALGSASSVNKRACDKLRCTSCDFRVSQFDNFEWLTSTDYLFLRNNVPDFDKLKSKLTACKGMRAYCCQCCWRSVQDLGELKDPKLKWVCGKH